MYLDTQHILTLTALNKINTLKSTSYKKTQVSI